jgi:hypothetical protein
MSILSDVGVALKSSLVDKLPKSILDFLTQESSDVWTDDVGKLYILKSIRWNKDDDQILELYDFLGHQRYDEYKIQEACFDYPDSNENDAGSWHDNPWCLSKVTSVELHYQ